MASLTMQERHNKIVEILNEKGRVTVNELSNYFQISNVAIRTDLSELEKRGMLTRVHGGAITSFKSYYDMSLVQRSNTNANEKKSIGIKINELVKDSNTIIMNAGTTPIFVMRELADKKITIVTNSIALALEGAKNPNFKIILLGGDVDTNYQFTYGVCVLNELKQYSADLLIMSVDGIDTNHGISTFYHHEAEICRHMINQAKKTIVVADNTKFGRTAFAKIDDINKIDTIVTDCIYNKTLLKNLKSKNIDIIYSK